MKNAFITLAVICAPLLAGEWFARSVLGLGDPPLSITHPRIEYLYAPGKYGHSLIFQAGRKS